MGIYEERLRLEPVLWHLDSLRDICHVAAKNMLLGHCDSTKVLRHAVIFVGYLGLCSVYEIKLQETQLP